MMGNSLLYLFLLLRIFLTRIYSTTGLEIPTNANINSINSTSNNSISSESSSSSEKCIRLTSQGIYLKFFDPNIKNYGGGNNNSSNEQLLINSAGNSEDGNIETGSSNYTIQEICTVEVKTLLVSFNSDYFGGKLILQFQFLINNATQEDNDGSYELAFVSLIHASTSSESRRFFAFKNFKSYSKASPFGYSSWCSDWVGEDLDAVIEIKDLQYEVFYNSTFQSQNQNDTQLFHEVASYCMPNNNANFVVNGLLPGNVLKAMKTTWSVFLRNIFIILGGCALLYAIFVGAAKLFPEKAKIMRKFVFQV